MKWQEMGLIVSNGVVLAKCQHEIYCLLLARFQAVFVCVDISRVYFFPVTYIRQKYNF